MQKNISILVLLTTISFFAGAQLPLASQTRETMDLYNINKFVSGEWETMLTENNMKGSPFLNDDFVVGTIYTTEKKQYDNVEMRLNIYNEQLEFKKTTGEILALATPEIIDIVVLGKDQIIYSAYSDGNKTKNGFFLIVEPGNAKLLAKPGIQFIPPTEPGAYKDAEPAQLKRKNDEYYIKVENSQAMPADNKKNLILAFPDDQDKIEAFISKNKTKINKPNSLAELVKYYNSL